MARYKPIDMSSKLIPVDFSEQVLPGTFEYALCHLIDDELDLSQFDAQYKNDEVGAPAYAPGLLLKITLLGYSRGLVSSRAIEAACRQNVLFMAVSGDAAPHFTTIAGFVSTLGTRVGEIFTQVLLVCTREGLIGRQMFAIDGVKLPGNASKARSGTRKDFARQAQKMEQAVARMLERHRTEDQAQSPSEPSLREREARQIERLGREAKQIQEWLKANPKDRPGAKGAIRKSNRTDNDSAKMATSKGVIQGYTAVAAVDEKHQIIVAAQAHGVGQEQELLQPVLDALQPHCAADTVVTADSGYHSKVNLDALEKRNIEAFIPDHGYRKRDERYRDQDRHRDQPDPLHDKRPQHSKQKRKLFAIDAFRPAPDLSYCECPAGKHLYRNGHHRTASGLEGVKFTGTKRDCGACPLRGQCLRSPQRTPVRQVTFFVKNPDRPPTAADRMKEKIDSAQGKAMIGRRFATVEPVFGNTRANKRLNRFTLRGQDKVDAQWKLYCLVHNVEKLAHLGCAR